MQPVQQIALLLFVLSTQRCQRDEFHQLMTGQMDSSALIFCILHKVNWQNVAGKKKKTGKCGKTDERTSTSSSYHITALQLHSHIYKAAGLGPVPRLREDSVKALPGTSLSAVQYSTVRNTTDKRSLWAVTTQSNRTVTMDLTGWFLVFCFLFHVQTLDEYRFHVYLRHTIISKTNKRSFRVGTAHYFPGRCKRDGGGIEVQQEMCHLSAMMTERSI